MIIDPSYKPEFVADTNPQTLSASPLLSGVFAQANYATKGFWWSPSKYTEVKKGEAWGDLNL